MQRSTAAYEQQADAVMQEPSLSKTYGIKGRSPLNSLSHFHVVDGLPPDIMHDLFESGVVTTLLERVVSHYITQGQFSLDYVLGRMNEFPYKGSDKTNKPDTSSCVTGSLFRLKLKATQVWCFLRLFPLLVGYGVDEGDETWEVVLALVDMVEIITGPVLSQATIAFMDEKIKHFHSVKRSVFPDMRMKPKDHYTLHYPELTRKYGPLRGTWSLRFEAKHSFFKNVARRTQNKKNLCKTMAMRHQYQTCALFESEACLGHGSGEYASTGGHVIEVASLPILIQDLIQPLLAHQNEVYQCESVSIHGATYAYGLQVVVGFDNQYPQFAAIEHCYIIAGIPYLLCSKRETVEFMRHFHAYCLRDTGVLCLFKVSELLDWYPLPSYRLKGYDAVVMHHYIEFD